MCGTSVQYENLRVNAEVYQLLERNETLKHNMTLGMDFRQRGDKRSDGKPSKSIPVPSAVAFKVYRQSRLMDTSLLRFIVNPT